MNVGNRRHAEVHVEGREGGGRKSIARFYERNDKVESGLVRSDRDYVKKAESKEIDEK